jgi:hypothetical protein
MTLTKETVQEVSTNPELCLSLPIADPNPRNAEPSPPFCDFELGQVAGVLIRWCNKLLYFGLSARPSARPEIGVE